MRVVCGSNNNSAYLSAFFSMKRSKTSMEQCDTKVMKYIICLIGQIQTSIEHTSFWTDVSMFMQCAGFAVHW